VRDRRGTADALNPDVLDPGDVGCDVAGGDDHLRGEGLVVAVTGAVEVAWSTTVSRSVVAVFSGSAAAPVHLKVVLASSGGVPADALAGQASGQRALADVAGAPEAARGLGEAGPRVEWAPPPVRKAAPVGKPLMPAALKPKPTLPPAATPATQSAERPRQHRRHQCHDLHLHLPGLLACHMTGESMTHPAEDAARGAREVSL
jgi:hypothetical protein